MRDSCVVATRKNTYFNHFRYLTAIFVIFSVAVSTCALKEAMGSTPDLQSSSKNISVFRSALDTYVASEPDGYGVYEERQSNVFKPGETLILYVEPEGITYVPTTEGNDELYNAKLSADIIISDTQGNVVAELTDLPAANIVSHHQNKELFLNLSVNQQSPFPPGDYVISYIVTDDNSGESFEITKNVAISE
jgi:hypothetical protein